MVELLHGFAIPPQASIETGKLLMGFVSILGRRLQLNDTVEKFHSTFRIVERRGYGPKIESRCILTLYGIAKLEIAMLVIQRPE